MFSNTIVKITANTVSVRKTVKIIQYTEPILPKKNKKINLPESSVPQSESRSRSTGYDLPSMLKIIYGDE